MDNYLTPSIARAIPLIQSAREDLSRQELVHFIADVTEDFTKGDPELADKLLEGAKSMPACVRYVLNEAAYVVEQSVLAMSDDERALLPEKEIHGVKATMAGGVVGKEQVEKWADDYYYKSDDLDPVGTKIKEAREKEEAENAARKAEADASRKKNKKGKAGSKAKAQSTGKDGSLPEEKAPSADDTQTSLFAS